MTNAPIHRMAPKNFYAVARGHRTGIYMAWDGPGGAREATDGFSDVRFKGFCDEPSAHRYMEKWTASPALTRHVTHHQPTTDGEHVQEDTGCGRDSELRGVVLKQTKRAPFPSLVSLAGIVGGFVAFIATAVLAWTFTGSIQ